MAVVPSFRLAGPALLSDPGGSVLSMIGGEDRPRRCRSCALPPTHIVVERGRCQFREIDQAVGLAVSGRVFLRGVGLLYSTGIQSQWMESL
jgi:hypothetical protein